jgi:hypothetical protein
MLIFMFPVPSTTEVSRYRSGMPDREISGAAGSVDADLAKKFEVLQHLPGP